MRRCDVHIVGACVRNEVEDLAELERVLATVDLRRKSRTSDIVRLDKMDGVAI
jgi:hypothetical protein